MIVSDGVLSSGEALFGGIWVRKASVVTAQAATDTYRRVMSNGWGTADIGTEWTQPGSTTRVTGSVEEGEGLLYLSGGLNTARLRLPRWNDGPVAGTMLGRFGDCEDPSQAIAMDLGFASATLTSNGLLTSRGRTLVLDHFDPCQPWYMAEVGVENGALWRVWQAVDDEARYRLVGPAPRGEDDPGLRMPGQLALRRRDQRTLMTFGWVPAIPFGRRAEGPGGRYSG